MFMQLPHFCPCFCNYDMGTNARYTCVTSNPCLCNYVNYMANYAEHAHTYCMQL